MNTVPQVITLTCNLLAEWTFYIDSLSLGKTHRASDESFQVGGKGINVSKMLNRLDVSNIAAFFANGHLADYCESWMWSEGFRTKRFHIGADTRVGMVVRPENQVETTILGKDKPIPINAWRDCFSWLRRMNPNALVLAGSFPGWTPEHAEVVERFLESQSSQLFIDTYGPALNDLFHLSEVWIKINRTELAQILPETTSLTETELIAHLQKEPRTKHLMITNGKQPIVIITPSLQKIFTPKAINENSPTGSGDVTMAGLVAQILKQIPIDQAVSFALACGTANAASNQIAEFDLSSLDQFRPLLD